MADVDPAPSPVPEAAVAPPDRVKLTGFRVRNYRSIVDSGQVPVFEVTALVGKNSTGKTSLLRALCGLQPERRRPYSLEDDWPRHISRARSGHAVVCRAELALPRAAAEELARRCELDALPETLSIGRDYAGAFEVDFPGLPSVDAPDRGLLLEVLSRLREPRWSRARALADPVRGLQRRGPELVAHGRWSELHDQAQAARGRLEEVRPGRSGRRRLVARRAAELQRLDELLAEIERRAAGVLARYARHSATACEFLPPFVHLGRETLFPEELDLARLSRSLGAGRVRHRDSAAAALLEACGLHCAELAEAADSLELDESARRLAARLGWEAELRPLLRVRGGRLSIARNPGDGRWARDAHRADAEWRWALTLELLLLCHRERQGEIVLLLDDPTRIFAETQRMRAWLQARSGLGTILYTAPLPFHVDLQHPEQLLVLSPTGAGPFLRRGLVSGAGSEGLDLRASLGMTGRSSFRISEWNLVVEGPYDVSVIGALAELARRSGEATLPEELNLIAAGGAREVAHVILFLDGLGLSAVALLDSDDAGHSARAFLEDSFRDRDTSPPLALDLGDLAAFDGREGAIEDLFPEAFYLECVRSACAEVGIEPCELPERLPGKRKITAELRVIFGQAQRPFPKGKAIEVILRRLGEMSSMAELPPEMLGPARGLLRGLRASVERLPL